MTGGESRIRPNREQQEEEKKEEKIKKKEKTDTHIHTQKVAREKMKSTRRSKRE